ncbi:unnamed protein product [Thlaspi arvense]|uniref:F-box domain-containing protein n=1 Tax=Thlaspi arvense TaxID=13288 RepID=A0AAU9RFX5_THLAR|nr:unnamed protein product [Thlaspi arvense]
MLKTHRSSVVLKRHHGSSVELLPDDVLELILESVAVKPLLRFRAVSKKWKTTIDSRRFQERQLIRRMQSRGPDVIFVYLTDFGIYGDDDDTDAPSIVLGSAIASTVRFPTTGSMFCRNSCDGLVCLYCHYEPSVVVNPATRWHQTFPLSNIQQFRLDRSDKPEYSPITRLGFGKDKFRGTYKPVCLYNSSEYGLDNVTTCEVFDFSTNAWRYVVPASPCRINDCRFPPVYLDGSLYWLTETEGEEPNVLSLDLHTETFQVICKAPVAHLRDLFDRIGDMLCILDDRLCFSETHSLTQVIWSFDSSGKTWKKLCSIDLAKTRTWIAESFFPLTPIAILDESKLLLQGNDAFQPLVIHDLHANSFDLLFQPARPIATVSYFQSLLSI